MFGAPPVIGAQTNAISGRGIALAPACTPGIPSLARRASIVATAPPRMITWTRFQARLNVATAWSRSRLAPLQLYDAYGLWQLFISPIRRMYAGEPYSAMP